MGSFVGAGGEQEDPVDRTSAMAEDLNEMLAQPQQDHQDLLPPVEGDSTTPEPPVESPAEPAEPEVYQLGNYTIPADQVDQVVGLVNWASSLTEEQAARVMAALNEQPEPTPPADSPTPPAEPDLPPALTELEEVDPAAAKALREMWERQQEELNQMRLVVGHEIGRVDEVYQSAEEREAAERYAAAQAAEYEARDRFTEAYDGIDVDVAAQKAIDLGIIPALTEKYGYEDGMFKALEMAVATDESLMAARIQSEAQALAAQSVTAQRKANAGSLTTPQAGTTIPAQNPTGLPYDERRAAMKRDIESLLGLQ